MFIALGLVLVDKQLKYITFSAHHVVGVDYVVTSAHHVTLPLCGWYYPYPYIAL
jgi:hypothetical protein